MSFYHNNKIRLPLEAKFSETKDLVFNTWDGHIRSTVVYLFFQICE